MGSDMKGRRIKPGGTDAPKQDVLAIASGTITKYDVVSIAGVTGGYLTVARSDNTNLAKSRSFLFMAKGAPTAGGRLLVTPFGVIKSVNTGSLAIGDAIYLGTTGGLSTTPDGFSRQVGIVTKIGGVGVGEIQFFGGAAGAGQTRVKAGTGTFTIGQPTLTITAATLGGTYGGLPVTATLNTADGAVVLKSASWSTNDLLFTLSANAGAADVVTYAIYLG